MNNGDNESRARKLRLIASIFDGLGEKGTPLVGAERLLEFRKIVSSEDWQIFVDLFHHEVDKTQIAASRNLSPAMFEQRLQLITNHLYEVFATVDVDSDPNDPNSGSSLI